MRFRVQHLACAEDALFWAADIVAGAGRAGRAGQGEHRRLLNDHISTSPWPRTAHQPPGYAYGQAPGLPQVHLAVQLAPRPRRRARPAA